jgi:hypothetical protein
MFQCLTPDQAASFASVVVRSETELDAMATEELLEVWRTTFGLQSSASVLHALSELRFKGDILSPSAWTDWHRRFMLVVKQAATPNLPPSKQLAKEFVEGCPSAFVRNDFLACESSTVEQALHLAIARLKDPGFIRSASAAISKERLAVLTAPRPAHAPGNRPGPPPPARHHDRDNDDKRQGGQAQARPAGPRPDAVTLEPARRPAERQQPTASSPLCPRCNKPGHGIEACISRHDAAGNKLDRVDPDVYAKRKEAAIRIVESRQASRPKVLGIADATDSDTEEIEGFEVFLDAPDHFGDDFCDGVHGVFEVSSDGDTAPADELEDDFMASIDDGSSDDTTSSFDWDYFPHDHIPESSSFDDLVPPSDLMLCGDIEPNPGPFDRKKRPLVCVAPPRNARNTIVLSPSRLTIGQSEIPTFAQRASFASPVSAIPAATLLFVILVYVFWPTAQPDQRYVEPPATDSPPDKFSCAATAERFERSLLIERPPSHTQWDTDDPHSAQLSSLRIPRTALLRVLVAMFMLLLQCGDVEANPGPHSTARDEDDAPAPVQLTPSALRRPPASFFEPRHPRPTPLSTPPDMPALISDSSSSDSDAGYQTAHDTIADVMRVDTIIMKPPADAASDCDDAVDSSDETFQALGLHAILHYESSDPDTSDVDNPDPVHVVAAAAPVDPLIQPPKFVGFLVARPPDSAPPLENAQVCVIDTMCQGEYSVISRSLVSKFKLPTTPFSRTSRTATGALVKCTHLASFYVSVFVHDAWLSVPAKALVLWCACGASNKR